MLLGVNVCQIFKALFLCLSMSAKTNRPVLIEPLSM